MHAAQDTAPFASLTPDCILNALESAGFPCDGRLLALNSYENRVYQVGLDEGGMRVVKFYRPGRWSDAAILEEHAFLQELAKAELPVVAALADARGRTLHAHGDYRFAVFPRQGGHAPELHDFDSLERMGRLLGRLRAIGALRPYRSRPRLDAISFGEEPREFLLTTDRIPAESREAYADTTSLALEQVRACFERAGEVISLRLHGDCYAGNVLWTDEGPHLVDFDDSRMGPAVQDLWMLVSGDFRELPVRLDAVLSGYETFHDFNRRELHLVEALRTLRMIHYAAWIARRWDDPAFPRAFHWFDSPRYWQDHIHELQAQIEVMAKPMTLF